MHLSFFKNKSQICWIRSRLEFLVVAESSTTLLHIFTLLVFPWILNGVMITFIVEDNHVGFVIALRKFKNSILNFMVGYSMKRPTRIQNSVVEYSITQNILLWIICWNICTLASKTFYYELFCRWVFCISKIQQILLWTICRRILTLSFETFHYEIFCWWTFCISRILLWNVLPMNILHLWDSATKYSADEHFAFLGFCCEIFYQWTFWNSANSAINNLHSSLWNFPL